MIGWLTFYVFFCGLVSYAPWFRARIRALNQRRFTEEFGSDHQSPALRKYRRTLAFFAGACAAFFAGACTAGFLFAGGLHTWLSPPERPASPDIELGYTHFFYTKHGGVYGTYFEYLAVTYGIWVSWGGLVLIGLIAFRLKLDHLYEGSHAYPLLFLAGSATSMVLYYELFQASLHVAQ